MFCFSTRMVCGFALSAIFVSQSLAEDWPQFRGAKGSAVVENVATPVQFGKENMAWKTAIPGTGWSSPVISDGKIWITTAETSKATPEQLAAKKKGVQFAQIKTGAGRVKLRAISVSTKTGEIVDNVLLRDVKDPDLINDLNSYASPTAAIKGNRVVCHFGSYGTWCLDKSTGDILWNKALIIDHSVGPGSSPVIAGDTVLIVCDGIDKQFIAGLDLKTGDKRWQTARPPIKATNGEYRKAYSTPLLIKVDGKTQAVIPGAQWMCAYEPTTGKEIWRADCGSGFSTTPMAVYESGLLVCSTGFMASQFFAINPSGSGDITKSNIVWKARGASTMPTAVGFAGMIYSISDRGVLTVLNSQTGKVIGRHRVGGNFAASPLLVGDKLYLGDQDGVMTVYGLKDMKQISRTKLDGALMASPAVLDSDLIVRTGKSLMRVTK